MRWLIPAVTCVACAGSPGPAPDAAGAAAPAVPVQVTVTAASDEARAAYDVALVAQDNFRMFDAIAGYEQALIHDPDFALAKARLGSLTSGNDGVLWLRQATADATAQQLPEAEQTLIGALAAFAEGEQARGNALIERVAELAPGEWRAHYRVGGFRYFEEDFEAAHAALETAVQLAPESGPAWNILGYTRAELGNVDQAVAAFDRYAALAPGEANPHDSAGEILMRAGRLEEAEARFTRALETDPGFYVGWLGVAQTRFLREDWEGGHEAVGQAHEAARRATDKLTTRTTTAWARLAQGDAEAAEAALSAADDEAGEGGLHTQYAYVGVTRGNLRAFAGDWEGARAAYAQARERAAESGLDPSVVRTVDAVAGLGTAYAWGMEGDADAARSAMPSVDDLLQRQPGMKPLVLLARSAIRRAEGDPAGAVDVLSECASLQHRCLHERAAAQEAAGDSEGAAATRAALRTLHARASSYLPVFVASR